MSEDEDQPERTDSLRALADAARRSTDALREMQLNLFLLCNQELREWNDEMDNCYPNVDWP